MQQREEESRGQISGVGSASSALLATAGVTAEAANSTRKPEDRRMMKCCRKATDCETLGPRESFPFFSETKAGA